MAELLSVQCHPPLSFNPSSPKPLPVNPSSPVATVEKDKAIQLAGLITEDYVGYRLRERNPQAKLKGLPKNLLIPPARVPPLHETVRRLCYQMEDENQVFFDSLCKKLKLERSNAEKVYFEVMTAVFKHEINWGRVLTLFSFTGVYAQHFLQSNDLDLIPEILQWASRCVRDLLVDWIQEKGGWEKMIDHFSGAPNPWREVLGFGSLLALLSLAFVWK